MQRQPSQGVTKVMKDSGISTKDTTRVSNKFNGGPVINRDCQCGKIVGKTRKGFRRRNGCGGINRERRRSVNDDRKCCVRRFERICLGAAGTAASEATCSGSCGRTD